MTSQQIKSVHIKDLVQFISYPFIASKRTICNTVMFLLLSLFVERISHLKITLNRNAWIPFKIDLCYSSTLDIYSTAPRVCCCLVK